jgi:hypothetical protein
MTLARNLGGERAVSLFNFELAKGCFSGTAPLD